MRLNVIFFLSLFATFVRENVAQVYNQRENAQLKLIIQLSILTRDKKKLQWI